MIYELTLGNPELTLNPVWATVLTAILIVGVHTFADFFLQTDEIAVNKSSSNKVLAIHIFWYMLPFVFFFGPVYAIVNGVLHFATDWCTSRIAKHYYLNDERHYFFCTIGVDQFIHCACLFLTLPLILGH